MIKEKLIITQNDYNDLVNASHKEVSEFVRNNISDVVKYGYGYYGCGDPKYNNGEYYVMYERGDSCD